jgi:hypothetical protein
MLAVRREIAMSYLLGGGEVILGLAVIALWFVMLFAMERRNGSKPLSSLAFAFWPSMFLLWMIAGCIMVLRGAGLV